jgi:hypothetical protein
MHHLPVQGEFEFRRAVPTISLPMEIFDLDDEANHDIGFAFV